MAKTEKTDAPATEAVPFNGPIEGLKADIAKIKRVIKATTGVDVDKVSDVELG